MPFFYNECEIPTAFSRKMIKLSLVKAGIYDGTYHRFIAQGFQPDMSTYHALETDAATFGFRKEDIPDIFAEVILTALK